MPELPEVERVRRTLAPHLVGRRIADVNLLRRDIWTPAPGPGPRSPADQLLRGAVVREVARHGKQLAIIAKDGRAISIHLGMTGQLIVRTPTTAKSSVSKSDGEPTTHIHARWQLEDRGAPRGELIFRDPRRFGGIWSFRSEEQLLAQRWSELGPDALRADAADLAARLAKSARPIKAALLDQTVLAGVGNIYADEALFEAGIHPLRHARRLNRADWDRLAAAIRAVLERAIAAGGSTLRDYVDADGLPGGARATHKVYGRGGKPCVSCGQKLHRAVIAQRTTVFCPHCQPRQTRRGPGPAEFSTQRKSA